MNCFSAFLYQRLFRCFFMNFFAVLDPRENIFYSLNFADVASLFFPTCTKTKHVKYNSVRRKFVASEQGENSETNLG